MRTLSKEQNSLIQQYVEQFSGPSATVALMRSNLRKSWFSCTGCDGLSLGSIYVNKSEPRRLAPISSLSRPYVDNQRTAVALAVKECNSCPKALECDNNMQSLRKYSRGSAVLMDKISIWLGLTFQSFTNCFQVQQVGTQHVDMLFICRFTSLQLGAIQMTSPTAIQSTSAWCLLFLRYTTKQPVQYRSSKTKMKARACMSN